MTSLVLADSIWRSLMDATDPDDPNDKELRHRAFSLRDACDNALKEMAHRWALPEYFRMKHFAVDELPKMVDIGQATDIKYYSSVVIGYISDMVEIMRQFGSQWVDDYQKILNEVVNIYCLFDENLVATDTMETAGQALGKLRGVKP